MALKRLFALTLLCTAGAAAAQLRVINVLPPQSAATAPAHAKPSAPATQPPAQATGPDAPTPDAARKAMIVLQREAIDFVTCQFRPNPVAKVGPAKLPLPLTGAWAMRFPAKSEVLPQDCARTGYLCLRVSYTVPEQISAARKAW